MCLPKTPLKVILKHVGQKDGRMLISISTVNVETGTQIISGMAEVEQAPTVYVFTGQGSQEQGMGMDLYNTSPHARKVWDEVVGSLIH
jgi:fatty acid synthase subunit alpha, fungi type